MGLARLFEMEYRGGRAASAPRTRVTAGTKATLGEEVSAVGGSHEMPIMPHRLHGEQELSRLYPPLGAVVEVDEDEQVEDSLLEKGIEIAKQIVADTESFGRRRVQKSSQEVRPLEGKEDLEAARLASTIGADAVSRTTLHGGGSR